MSSNFFLNFNYTYQDIAQLITKIRKEKKLTIYKLALKSCVDKSVIRRIEIGEREAYCSTLLKIIDGLDMTPAQFFARLE